MTDKAFKGNLQELAFIDWILESPERRFGMFYRNGGIGLFERDEQQEDGRWTVRRIHSTDTKDADTVARFGGKIKLDEYGLRNAGLVTTSAVATSFKEERARFDAYVADIDLKGGKWVYNSVLVTLTPKATEWWASEGKARYDKLVAKLQAKKAAEKAKERVAIFGIPASYGSTEYAGEHTSARGRVAEILGIAKGVVPKWRGMRPAFSAVIIRETETRYYVRDAKKLSDVYLPIEGPMTVEGRYVDKDKLILDNATEQDIAKLREFDAGICADYSEMRDELLDALVPVLMTAYERNDQKGAEIDGTFSELLAKLKQNKE